jgi:plasmid stabilization system protein ParE
MSLAIVFRRTARAEFIAAAKWYEVQRTNLGLEFIAESEQCVALAAEQPEIYALVHKGARRITAERFPYSVYFRAETRRIVVLAVFHGSRDPTHWQGRA